MLVVALKYGLAPYTIMMVACMSVAELYQENQNSREAAKPKVEDPNIDPDLVTQIDRDRNEKKQRREEM